MPLEHIRRQGKEVTVEVREKIIGYIVAAFSLVAGLAWNDAIKGLIEQIFPTKQNTIWAQFIYAILISVVVVVVSMYLLKLMKKNDEKKGS